MGFFRERNGIKTEYSGYQEASKGLRERLAAIIKEHSVRNIGFGNEDVFLYTDRLDHETKLHLNKDCLTAILMGTYDEVFEALEIFTYLIREDLRGDVVHEILDEIQTVFRASGSVYQINTRGEVNLQISEETASSIKETESALMARSAEAMDFFRRALSDLLKRDRDANDIVKDFSVSLEEYINVLAGKSDFKTSLKSLRDNGIIAAAQYLVLEKLYAYRGDAHGVAHSGNTPEPKEIDAIWFLETLVVQIKMIEAKLKLSK